MPQRLSSTGSPFLQSLEGLSGAAWEAAVQPVVEFVGTLAPWVDVNLDRSRRLVSVTWPAGPTHRQVQAAVAEFLGCPDPGPSQYWDEAVAHWPGLTFQAVRSANAAELGCIILLSALPGACTRCALSSSSDDIQAAVEHMVANTPHSDRVTSFPSLVALASFGFDLERVQYMVEVIGTLALGTDQIDVGEFIHEHGHLAGLIDLTDRLS